MSDSNKDRLTFQEAQQELEISEAELEKLVASGEVASIKEGDTFFFKPEAIAQYKKGMKTEPSIILSDEDMGLLDDVDEIDLGGLGVAEGEAAATPESAAGGAEELELDDLEIPELSLEGAAADAGDTEPETSELVQESLELVSDDAATDGSSEGEDTVLNLNGLLDEEEIGSEGTTPVPGTDVQGLGELELEGEGITLEGDVDDDTILDTDVLELTDEDESFDFEAASEEELSAEAVSSTLIRGGGARVMQMKRVKSQSGWTICLLLACLLMLLPLAVLINIFFYDTNAPGWPDVRQRTQWIEEYNFLRSPVESVADLVQDLFPGR